jgi:hypothetical protein
MDSLSLSGMKVGSGFAAMWFRGGTITIRAIGSRLLGRSGDGAR